jgi:hypothetical protein
MLEQRDDHIFKRLNRHCHLMVELYGPAAIEDHQSRRGRDAMASMVRRAERSRLAAKKRVIQIARLDDQPHLSLRRRRVN